MNIKIIISIIAVCLFLVAKAQNIGDIKIGFQDSDHQGWYLLDGRSVSSLPPAVQSNAASVNLTVLPGAQGKFFKNVSGMEDLMDIGGSNIAALERENLPDYNYTGTTNVTGNHTHNDVTDTFYTQTFAGSGFRGGPLNPAFEMLQTNRDSSVDGAHTHTFAFNSGGGDQSFSIVPQSIVVNAFIYLGQ